MLSILSFPIPREPALDMLTLLSAVVQLNIMGTTKERILLGRVNQNIVICQMQADQSYA